MRKDCKPFWRYINNQKADKQGIPPLVTTDQKVANSDEEKAETLNNKFTSVFTRTEYPSIPLNTPTVKTPEIFITKKGVEKILKCHPSLHTQRTVT